VTAPDVHFPDPGLLGNSVTFGPIPAIDDDCWADLPFAQGEEVGAHLRIRASPTLAVAEVMAVGRYLFRDGTNITIEPFPYATEQAVQAWLRSALASIIAGQQGTFALHGNVIEIDGVRIAVTGDRGTGKSTSTIAAMLAGAVLITDDVTVLSVDEDAGSGQGPTITHVPFDRPVNLWRETANALGIDVTDAPAVVTGLDKVCIPGPYPVPDRKPLQAIVLLVPMEIDHPVRTRMQAIDTFQVVCENTYRPTIVAPVWPGELFRWQVAIAGTVPVFTLQRPRTWSVDAVVDELFVLAHELRE
jgi:hypothetical protein